MVFRTHWSDVTLTQFSLKNARRLAMAWLVTTASLVKLWNTPLWPTIDCCIFNFCLTGVIQILPVSLSFGLRKASFTSWHVLALVSWLSSSGTATASLGAEEWLWKKMLFFHGGKEEFLEWEQLDRIFRDSNCSFIFDSKPWPSCREAADWNNSCSSAMSCILGLKHVSMHFCPMAMCREVISNRLLALSFLHLLYGVRSFCLLSLWRAVSMVSSTWAWALASSLSTALTSIGRLGHSLNLGRLGQGGFEHRV